MNNVACGPHPQVEFLQRHLRNLVCLRLTLLLIYQAQKRDRQVSLATEIGKSCENKDFKMKKSTQKIGCIAGYVELIQLKCVNYWICRSALKN